MREHDLQPRRRRRCVATTDSDHDQPIYPNRAKDLAIDGPDQLWVADITYVAIREGFAYVAVILDAWGGQFCEPIDNQDATLNDQRAIDRCVPNLEIGLAAFGEVFFA